MCWTIRRLPRYIAVLDNLPSITLGFFKNKDEKFVQNMKLKEIKNGRLAMVGVVGMIWAYAYTGQPTI